MLATVSYPAPCSCAWALSDRIHTREIARYGGLVERMPKYADLMVFMLASIGLPGTSGFVGEFLILVGAFEANTWVAAWRRRALFWARPTCSISIAG